MDVFRQVKVYSVEDYKVIHSMSYSAPVMSMGMSVSVVALNMTLRCDGVIFSLQTATWL